MTSVDPESLPSVAKPADGAWLTEHEETLRRFVWGLVRESSVVADVVQATLAIAWEKGQEIPPSNRKAWLFQVAYNEAMQWRRRRSIQDRAYAGWLNGQRTVGPEPPDRSLARGETIEAVRRAINELPAEQRSVVVARMYEEKTFAEIAREGNVALGTVLTRMRLALDKLRGKLRGREGECSD